VSGRGSEPPGAVTETKPRIVPSQPEIHVGYTPAGRGTLDAITGELVSTPPATPERESSSPEIVVEETFAERDTLAAIMEEARTEVRKRRSSIPELAPLEIFEMLTFVVRGSEAQRMSSEAARQRFVEEHLLPRLPIASMADVERVEVTPWTTPGTLVVRVWCRVQR
jgi:hypothetical protein